MAYSYNVYTGNGSTTQFTIGFSYIRREHVKVYVAYVDTAYTYVNDTTVQLATAPGAGVRVEVRRVTPATTPLVDFADGSTLVAADLDTSNLQHLYLEQELDDANKQAIFVDPATGLLTAANQRITNVADPVNAQDVSTKAYTDAQIDSALINDVIAGAGLTISDNTPTAGQITVGITNSGVGATQIADGAVTSAKIADATIITGDLADGAVTSAKIADGTIVAGDLASDSVTTAKILNANVTTAKIADLNVTTGKIADLGVTTGKIADAAVTAAKIAGGSIDSTKLDGATVVTNSEHSGSTPNDTSFFTTSASDARYFRQDSSETISSGNTWSASDSYIATTAAIDARVIDLVDDVGGFVPIANENSFPVANPDINNPDGTGTIISIAVMSTSRTPSSGTVTIANGSGSNTVTITGCGSTVLAAGFGVLVETTSTLHTYTFHRLTPKATEVTTVASISADVTTVAGNNANVTAVAGNAANITTVAGSIANVNAVGGSIANVNSVASNLASVNSFANTYRIAASDPATSLDVGDLVFNTTASELRVYNGSVWQGGVTATGNLVSRAGDTMIGPLAHPLGADATPSITFTGDTNTGIYSPGADQVAISSSGAQRLTIDASGRVLVGTGSATGDQLLIVQGYTGVSVGNAEFGLRRGGNPTVADQGLGAIAFQNNSGNSGARIEANSAGAWTSGSSHPTYLALSTTASGSSSPSERLRITSAGLVGVGVSAPSELVHLGSGGKLRFNRADNATGTTIHDGGNAGFIFNSLNNDPFVFQMNGTEKVRIQAVTGNVGIGVSGPSKTLDIAAAQGTIGVTSNTTSAGNEPTLTFTHAGNNGYVIKGGNNLQFASDSGANTRMTLTTGGSLGIGSTAPGEKLTVADSGSANVYIALQNSTTGTASTDGWYLGAAGTEFQIYGKENGPITFSLNSSEKARIDTSGRLLVGTSTNSNVSTACFATRSDGAASAWVYLQTTETTPANGNTIGSLVFNSTGNTSVNSSAYIICQRDGGTWTNTTSMPGRLSFSTTADGAASPTERFRIGSAGQLGIGGATYGTAGQVLTSGGASAAPTWSSVSGLGVGQTWQNVTASRAFGTTYTNSTGKPIEVVIAFAFPGAGATGVLTVGGVAIQFGQVNSAYINIASGSAIVPTGATYVFSTTTTLISWMELR